MNLLYFNILKLYSYITRYVHYVEDIVHMSYHVVYSVIPVELWHGICYVYKQGGTISA